MSTLTPRRPPHPIFGSKKSYVVASHGKQKLIWLSPEWGDHKEWRERHLQLFREARAPFGYARAQISLSAMRDNGCFYVTWGNNPPTHARPDDFWLAIIADLSP